MGNQVPVIPVGRAPITTWYNRVSNAIPANRLASSPDFRIKQTSRGTILLSSDDGIEKISVDDRGTYNSASHYAPGDLTTVYSGTVSASAGTWICETAVPSKTISDNLLSNNQTSSAYAFLIRLTSSNYAPTWPEPASPPSTLNGEGRYWRRISGEGGGTVSAFKVQSVVSESLVCRTFDGTSTGSTDIQVAKPYKLRQSAPNPVTIDSETITYSAWNWANQSRTATIGATSKTEVITPRYLTNDIIWATETTTCTTGSDASTLTWLDLNVDGRAWALKKGQ